MRETPQSSESDYRQPLREMWQRWTDEASAEGTPAGRAAGLTRAADDLRRAFPALPAPSGGVTRREAIAALAGAWDQRDQEFCVGNAEFARSAAEMYEAFAALGVPREEIDAPPAAACTCRGMDEAPGCDHGLPRDLSTPPGVSSDGGERP